MENVVIKTFINKYPSINSQPEIVIEMNKVLKLLLNK